MAVKGVRLKNKLRKQLRLGKVKPAVRDTAPCADPFAEAVTNAARERLLLLPEEDREIALELLEDAARGGERYDALYSIDFKRKPVDIEQFLDDPMYMGGILYEDPNEPGLWPRWRDELLDLFSPTTQYQEWILGGAIGVGKTTIVAIALTYMIYLLSCLRTPHKFYGLLPNMLLVFGVYSITKTQASDVAYGKVRWNLEHIPYFKRRFPLVLRTLRYTTFERNKRIRMIAGCLVEGTLISTPYGEIPIEELANSADRVTTVNLKTKRAYSETYKGVAKTGRKKCLLLTSASGRAIKCSLNHKFLVEGTHGNVHWKKAKHIKVGEAVFTLQGEEADKRFPNEKERSGRPNPPTGLSEMREQAPEGVLPQKQGTTARKGQSKATYARGASRAQSAKRQILPRASRRNLGEESQTQQGPCQCCATVMARTKSQENSRLPKKVQARRPRRASGIFEKKKSRAKSHEACNSVRLHNRRRKVCVEVLQEPLHVLWEDVERSGNGSSPSTVLWKSNDGDEHGSGLQELQFSEARQELPNIHSAEVLRGTSGGNNREDCRVHRDRIVSVEEIGVLNTYDVVEVPNTHAIIANGFVNCQSREFHAIGMDLFGFVLDEGNFFKQQSAKTKTAIAEAQEQVTEAYKIYHQAFTRIESRFGKAGGGFAGMVFMISSKSSDLAFLEEHIKRQTPKIKAGKVKLTEFAIWDVRPKRYYILPRFEVEVGDELYSSRILNEHDVPRDLNKVIAVPGEYLDDFTMNVDQALRDHAGISTIGTTALIRDRESITRCITSQFKHPFTRQSIVLDYRGRAGLQDYFDLNTMLEVRRSKRLPIHHSQAARFCHVDLALTGDAAGIAIAHVAGMSRVKRMRQDGSFYYEDQPEVWVDLMLQIVPPAGAGQISIQKIRQFIIYLRASGLPIVFVSTDGYQSADMHQILRTIEHPFDSRLFSVDRTDDAYCFLRNAILEDRIRYYDYPPFLKEVRHLVHDLTARKVDHPMYFDDGTKGAKDVADAVAAVVMQCIETPNAKIAMHREKPIIFLSGGDTDEEISYDVSPELVDALEKELDRRNRLKG